MKNLNDQWVEVINGVEHMLKAVEGHECLGCAYGYRLVSFVARDDGDCEEMLYEHECKIRCPFDTYNLIVKDLGILNADGFLPCPFTGVYPRLKEIEKGCVWEVEASIVQKVSKEDEQAFCWDDEYYRFANQTYVMGASKQQAIDAWNRRF
jgi:hypothetical protein